MNNETKQKVKQQLSDVMERILIKRTEKEPFNEDDIKQNNPFGYRLVPVEVWKGSKFERSFVTSLGQGIFEQIAKIIAEGSGAEAKNQYIREINLNTWQIEQIDSILKKQRHKSINKKNISDKSLEIKAVKEEVSVLRELEIDRFEKVSVLFDLYIKRQDGKEEFYSLKTVKPNLDQTETAKKDMLRLMTAEDAQAFFALPYNPAGDGNLYKSIHAIPYKLFDMDNDENVLIGRELWNKIGQADTTYDELLELFNEIGGIYRTRIRKEYFGI